MTKLAKLISLAFAVSIAASAAGCYAEEHHGPEYDRRCHDGWHWDGWDCHHDGEPDHHHR